MNLTLGKINENHLDGHQVRYIIHINSDAPLTTSVIELWNERMGKNLGWKSIERNRINPKEVILIVEKSTNFKAVAKEKIQRWLEIMVELAAAP